MKRLFGWWRKRVVEPRIFGRVLDVGCWKNKVDGAIGIDICFNNSLDIHCSYVQLPFIAESFDCCCMVASCNYIDIKDRRGTFLECHRVLQKYGRLVVTCTTPLGGFVHRLFRWRQPQGINVKVLRTLVEENGFRLVYDKPFMFWLNHLYVFGKEVVPTENLVQIQKAIREEMHEH